VRNAGSNQHVIIASVQATRVGKDSGSLSRLFHNDLIAPDVAGKPVFFLVSLEDVSR
jgi:hypothetical protein